ncbi:tubby-like F-box protein 5 [Prosopis cineraria]|uniref:tubby-like F-box protein 5 n=1 Tax=Prosopis cineraria TaxID=364024 RepID=UPI00240F28DD|nr:tubby-like F-box protein 5 [Prosopis cineraria]XP_054823711.1 tubby-like F-box protein 5 [Prosopis cineraria]
MPFRDFVRELREIRDGMGNISRRGIDARRNYCRGKSLIAPELSSPASSSLLVTEQGHWANLPPELLLDIIQRVEASETSWPARRAVVACASVCRSWRKITEELVKTPEQCGWLTFPISLKQPGPRETPIQCFIKRERATSKYHLYLGLSPALSGDMSKLLLAAKKIRRTTCTEFFISLVADDFSKANNTYVGKLRSNFLGTKFMILDSQIPLGSSLPLNNNKLQQRIHSKQVLPRVAAAKCNVATISYELNVLRTRGPRRMRCTMHSIPISSVQEGGTAPTPLKFTNCLDEHLSTTLISKGKEPGVEHDTISDDMPPELYVSGEPLILKNKAPRWHEQLQCWCLNFKGRVTVASVKNFQLVAAAEPQQNVSAAEQDRVILQFGKIGKDIFTMDYRYPLSAFQAFAICLSSFDTKPACE